VDDTRRFSDLRAQYRSEWDAYQIIAHRNVMIRDRGGQPTDQQLADQRTAAKAVQAARDQLLAAIPRLGQ